MEPLTALSLFGLSVSMVLLLAGASLMVMEAIIPGGQFIVLGLTTFITGVIGVLTPVGDSVGLLTVTFCASILLTYVVFSKLDFYPKGDSGISASSDSDDLIGKEGEALVKITQTAGRVQLDDMTGFSSEYQARSASGQTIEAGTRVIVTDGGGGSVVKVEEDVTKDTTSENSSDSEE
jgi:membrane protein implicated in regulation of membrane protease activity